MTYKNIFQRCKGESRWWNRAQKRTTSETMALHIFTQRWVIEFAMQITFDSSVNRPRSQDFISRQGKIFTFLTVCPGATPSPSRRYKGQCSPSCQQVLELQHHPQGAVRGNVHLPVSRSWSYNITLKALLGRMFTFLSAGHGATTSPSRRYKGGVHLPVSRSCSYNITLKALLGRMFTFLTAGHRATTSPLRRC